MINCNYGKGEMWLSTVMGTFQHPFGQVAARKSWRRRLIWEHRDDPGNHQCYAIILLPPRKPTHNRMTVTRKIWSKSIRQYVSIDGNEMEGAYRRYSPFDAFPTRRK